MVETTPVFVYGTLREGQKNRHYMDGQTFIGHGQTAQHFALYLFPRKTGTGSPAVILDEALYPIRGELWHVDEAGMTGLDKLEDYPHDYYRQLFDIALDSGESAQAWMYFRPHCDGILIEKGDYSAHIAAIEG